MTRIVLREEVKAHPRPENDDRLYNSPPSFEGRYLLINDRDRPIQGHHFTVLKQKNLIHYRDSEYLEDCDLFDVEPGWRLKSQAIDYLKQQGYDLDIATLEDQRKALMEYAEEKRKEGEIYEKIYGPNRDWSLTEWGQKD